MTQEWKFPSSSSSTVYTTKRNIDGSLSCNCRGWTFKRGTGPRECKHTRQVALRDAGASQVLADEFEPTPDQARKLPARNELERCSGSQFDPDVVAAFLRALDHAGAPSARS